MGGIGGILGIKPDNSTETPNALTDILKDVGGLVQKLLEGAKGSDESVNAVNDALEVIKGSLENLSRTVIDTITKEASTALPDIIRLKESILKELKLGELSPKNMSQLLEFLGITIGSIYKGSLGLLQGLEGINEIIMKLVGGSSPIVNIISSLMGSLTGSQDNLLEKVLEINSMLLSMKTTIFDIVGDAVKSLLDNKLKTGTDVLTQILSELLKAITNLN